MGLLFLLASGANSKKLELVGDGSESTLRGNPRFELSGLTFLNFHHLRTIRANQMVVMPVIAGTKQLETRHTISKIKPFHHSQFLKHVQSPVNRRQVAALDFQAPEQFLCGQWMRRPAKGL